MKLKNEFSDKLRVFECEYKYELEEKLNYKKAYSMLNKISDTRVCGRLYFDSVYHGIIKEKFGEDITFDQYCHNIDLIQIMRSFTLVMFAAQFLDAVDANPGFTETQYIAAYKAANGFDKKAARA